MTVRLVIVDGHTLCRLGLARIIDQQPDLELVDEAADAEEGRHKIGMHRPDVVVVSLSLPDDEALRLIAEVRGVHPAVGVVAIGTAESTVPMFRAMDARASAFVAKTAPSIEITGAIRHAAVAPGSFTASGLAAALDRRRAEQTLLTPRERETLGLLMNGLSIAKIGHCMNLSPNTAKTYTARLYEKLGANNRTQAVMAALRLGLITTEQDSPLPAMAP